MQSQGENAGVIPYTNTTGSAIASGGVIDLTHRVGVALVAIAASANGSVAVAGVFVLAKDSSTIGQNDEVYWDVSASKVTTTQGAGDPRLGIAVAAAGTSASYVRVEINAPRTVGDAVIGSGAGDAAGNAAAIQSILEELEQAGITKRN